MGTIIMCRTSSGGLFFVTKLKGVVKLQRSRTVRGKTFKNENWRAENYENFQVKSMARQRSLPP